MLVHILGATFAGSLDQHPPDRHKDQCQWTMCTKWHVGPLESFPRPKIPIAGTAVAKTKMNKSPPAHTQANDWNQPTTQTRPNQEHTIPTSTNLTISFSRMEEPLLCGEDPRYPPDGNPRGVDTTQDHPIDTDRN
ncbi:hypothetical protein L3Y34_005679 [Caenorhabditis briggsae]|uniref:Uncharacterized protein n=1 Tax=Caenorhabditis briggsae TaxID=6238 RepID=A0AAE9D7N5_CAEBR|nr:hypothetical protein L3Y34_005679 [Caenorhabditis briggsae]